MFAYRDKADIEQQLAAFLPFPQLSVARRRRPFPPLPLPMLLPRFEALNASTIGVHRAEVILSARVALLGCFAVPHNGLHIISGNALPVLVH
jgi:hypothetical protein